MDEKTAALHYVITEGKFWLTLSLVFLIPNYLLLWSIIKNAETDDDTEILVRTIILIIFVIFNLYTIHRSLVFFSPEWPAYELIMGV